MWGWPAFENGREQARMFEVSVTGDFDAAHALRGYKGKCENLHGHRFQVTANVRINTTNDIGITCDFVDLRRELNAVLDRFDHSCLNDKYPFDTINPSSENIAASIYNDLAERLKSAEMRLHSVQVWESPNSMVTYFPDE